MLTPCGQQADMLLTGCWYTLSPCLGTEGYHCVLAAEMCDLHVCAVWLQLSYWPFLGLTGSHDIEGWKHASFIIRCTSIIQRTAKVNVLWPWSQLAPVGQCNKVKQEITTKVFVSLNHILLFADSLKHNKICEHPVLFEGFVQSSSLARLLGCGERDNERL